MQIDLFGHEPCEAKQGHKDWRWAKPMLLADCDSICYLCDEAIVGQFAVDHFIPLAHGGADELYNLKAAHAWCNQMKSDLMPDDPRLPALIAQAVVLAKEDLKDRRCTQCHTASIAHKGWSAVICDSCVAVNKKAAQKRYAADWYVRNAEHVKAKSKTWREQNPEQDKANKKSWLARNPDYERKRSQSRDQEKMREYRRAYWSRHKDRINAGRRKGRGTSAMSHNHSPKSQKGETNGEVQHG